MSNSMDSPGMTTLGVVLVVIREGHVILIERDDFEVWCLPGGFVDPGESVAQAARREVREETGLDVDLTRFLGLYSLSHWLKSGHHMAAFVAESRGAVLALQSEEVKRGGYFPVDDLPEPLLWGTRQVLSDAVAGMRGVVRSAETMLDVEYSDLMALRDASCLPPSDFYVERIVPRLGPDSMSMDVDAAT